MLGELPRVEASGWGKFNNPKDFTKDAQVYRRNILVSFSIAFLVVTSESLEPKLLGVSVSSLVLWFCLAIAHIYQFIMWRLTSTIEMDSENTSSTFKACVGKQLQEVRKIFRVKRKPK